MQINFNQLSIAKIIMLSKHIKEKCINLSSFEEVAQELMRVLYSSFVTDGGRSPFVLARFFKSCAYDELPDDIRNYIHNKESKENLISSKKYLTLLGSFGELDNWNDRNLSKDYKAFPIHDEHMLDKFPMLSAVFDQIGFKFPILRQTDKSILIKDYHKQYGVFCVENAEGSNLIPKQAEFVRPYSVKSVFGFGGIYSTSNVYAVLIFSRERLSRKDAQLFLSLNPAVKQITLAHEITGNIFKTDRKDTNASVDGICDELPTVQIKSQNKTTSRQHKDIIEKEMVLSSGIELEMANDYLLEMSEAQSKSHEQLEKQVKERTQELNESKEQIQLLLDSTGEAIYGIDNDGKCTFANVACLRMLGYKEVSQIIRENMHDLIHHTKKDGTPYHIEGCRIYQVFKEGKGTHVDDEVFWRADGTCFPVEYMSFPIRKDNKIIGAVVTFSDITKRNKAEEEIKDLNQTLEQRIAERTAELSQINKDLVQEVSVRKMAEEARQASEERLLSLSKATFEGIVFHKEGVILDCNEQFADMVGYKLDELIGTDGLTLAHPEDRELTRSKIATENEDPYELRLLCKDGSIKFVKMQAQMMLINGERLRVTAFRDITNQQKMEEELLKMQKLESLGVLAGGIAHDFNNNLQSIVSCIALAKTYANPEDEICGKLEEAQNVVLQSKSLAQQLLTFSRGGEPVKNTISISKLIKYSANLALSGSNVRCELGIPDNLSLVEADKGQLSQAISNLIINADQAMPEGGNIKLWAENINVVEKDQIPLQQGRYVKITVADQGVGISQGHLQNIFDPYFTTKETGSGLGLATSYSIIKKHEGYISVESEVGVGTTFRIYLPASSKEIRGISTTSEEKRSSTAPVDKVDEETPNVSKGKVLLMDDEPTIRLFISQHLINLKYEVETTEDGVEAIGLYKKAMKSGKPFDAIIMDLTIPGGMGGKEAIEKLLEIDPEVRAIVASGYADDLIMAEPNKYGFCGVLVKPYEIDELDETLHKVITIKDES